MLIYNITTKVDDEVAEEWVRWMKKIQIPKMLATGCFEKVTFVKLLLVDERDGLTYAAQYVAQADAYDKYTCNYAPQLETDNMQKWGNRTVFFSTLMQVLD